MNHSRTIVAEPLTREAFAPFHEVIDTGGADSFPINQGRTERFQSLATVELLVDEGKTPRSGGDYVGGSGTGHTGSAKLRVGGRP
ncbi:MAG: hypothetical protein ACI92B_000665 [Marinobacter maritimus]|jgi:hypothetical protein|nr:ureidoglycolate lyase [Oceanospirillales bacterium]